MDAYEDIMKLAFQGEEAIDASVVERFGRKFHDKQVIIREGDVQQKIFWVLEGEVYVTRRVGDKYKVLATLGRGEIIGEMSFFDKSVRSATVIAKGDVHVLEFTRENFADIYAASPQWTRRLLVSLAKRIRGMVEKLSWNYTAMPRVTVRLDPRLEELLRPPRRGPFFAAAPPGATLLAVIEDLGIPGTEIGHVAVNGRPASPTDRPSEGDQIAVEAVPGEHGTTPPRFLLDVHLGRLARLLRLLGFDAAWSRDAADAALAADSSREGRILLSRDRGLLKRREVRRGCLVRSLSPREQVDQVVARYGLRRLLSPFSRCLVCNASLERAAPGDEEGTAPQAAGRCPGCGRRYWRGSHWEAMVRLVEEIRRGG